ncbi:MAG TPA: carboxypeptidase regulatory-like domain-containing protein [Bacteroidaceae bacterium]|nr:carboxypeptidase regulatory-like domain-containing protein [Bacteroidaceae bacterium]
MKRIIPFAFLSCFNITLLGQITSSSIMGRVTENGEEVIGANVIVVHNESGIRYGASTNKSGLYAISGLRPGEYYAEFSYIGYITEKISNINISVGEQYSLNVQLTEEKTIIKGVDVVANRSSFIGVKTGQTFSVKSNEISLLPSVNRTILDYIRLSPYSGDNNSMSGRDGRVTSLTIDGANLNNSFGLNSTLPGAGNPVSLDVVDEVQIVIAPYDVRESNFTGGGINIITKSGTNLLKGTAYTYQRDENLRGNSVDGYNLGKRETEAKSVYGFTLGGPIIKNKLFFFMGGEIENYPQPISKWKLSNDGIGNADAMISRVTQADMERFSSILANNYGYDTGSTDLSKGGTNNFKILGRIDWSISDYHKLMLRYNYTKNSEWFTPNNTTTVGTPASSNRISDNGYAFRGNCYTVNDIAWSSVIELNSRIGESLSNRLIVTASDVSNSRDSESEIFPHIDIWDGNGNVFMSAGYELFSHNTGNNVRTYNISDQLRWSVGNNIITAGLSYEYQNAATTYMMFGAGYYKYASIDDFIKSNAPIAFGLTYGYDGVDDPSSRATFGQTAIYAQNEVRLSDNFTLTYGIRADILNYYEKLKTNKAYKAIDWARHFFPDNQIPSGYVSPVIDSGQWPESKIQISPRIGFNWNTLGNGSLILRGGAGLFTGRVPLVFFTNIPNASNMLQNTVSVTNNNDGVLSGLSNNMLTKVDDMKAYLRDKGYQTVVNDNGSIKSATICGITENFKLPQVLKTSLGADIILPITFPATFTIEGIYNKDFNAVITKNYNILNDGNFNTFSGADNRLNFRELKDGTSISQPVIDPNVTGGASVMANTDKGYSYSISASLRTEPIINLFLDLSYIHSDARSVTDMTGSSLFSTWKRVYSINSANEESLKRSGYVVPDKFIAAIRYKKEHGERFATSFGVFYTGQTSGTYSYCYSNDMNGDGSTNDLIYIPAHKDEIIFIDYADNSYTAEQQSDAFWSFIEKDKYLSANKGNYSEAYAAKLPWVNRFDVRITEDIKIEIGNNINKFQISFDIMNIGNLINNSWGVYKTASECNNGMILTYKGTDSQRRPLYNLYSNNEGLLSKTSQTLKNSSNCWFLQIGLRYFFN